MVAGNQQANIDQALSSFNNLTVDEKLALLWYVYTKMGESITPAAPGAAGTDIASGLYDQVKQLSHQEQLDVQRQILKCEDTQIAREYGSLSQNTKLLFWYQLAQGMEEGTIIPVPEDYEPSGGVEQLLSQIELMEFEDQITFLRDSVAGAGAEPKSGAAI